MSQLKVLVVGQVPPPYSGQNVMVEALLRGTYDHAQMLHVNAGFSDTVADMGRRPLRKVGRLVEVAARSFRTWLRHRPDVLYYHPAGASRIAVIRDIALLTVLRPLLQTVVFHVHALGLAGAVAGLPAPIRVLARRAYRGPDAVIGPSRAVADDVQHFFGREVVVVPNGTAGGVPPRRKEGEPALDHQPLRILFMNMISEAKGASWLVEAVAGLRDEGLSVELDLAGEVASAGYRRALEQKIDGLGLSSAVRFLGVLQGQAKWDRLAACDVFCVPTTYEQETFGMAMVEAASCARPVVTTNVPGVSELFEPRRSVLLADPDDPGSLGRHLSELCRDQRRRVSMGLAARQVFEERYTLERFWERIDEVFEGLSTNPAT